MGIVPGYSGTVPIFFAEIRGGGLVPEVYPQGSSILLFLPRQFRS